MSLEAAMEAVALDYYAFCFDLPVFPLRPRGKEPRISKADGGNGHNDATTDEARIRAWWREWPDANIGVAVPAEYIVFDVDPRHGAGLEDLGDLPDTVMARSGSGGWHVWFRLPAGVALHGGEALPGVDIRKHGNYVVMPPSVHPSGGRYAWCDGHRFEDFDDWQPALIPDHLLKLVVKPERPAPEQRKTPLSRPATTGDTSTVNARPTNPYFWLAKAVQRVQAGDDGGRNHTGFWLATQLRDHDIAEAAAEAVLVAYVGAVTDQGDHPYTEDEALKSLRSAYEAPRREPAQSARTSSAAAPALPSSPVGGPQQQQAGDSNTFTAGWNKARTEVRDSGSAELDSSAQRENPGSAVLSFTSFVLSQKTDSMGLGPLDEMLLQSIPDPNRRDLMRAMQIVDAWPDDGPIRHHGTNAQQRRQGHYGLLREAWHYLFPENSVLSEPEVSTCLGYTEGYGVGVLDMMFTFKDAPRESKLRSPRAAFIQSLLNATNPEKGAKVRAAKQEVRMEYKQANGKKQARGKEMGASETSTPPPAANAPKTEDARWEAARAECSRLRIDFEKVSRDPFSGKRHPLDVVERLVRQFTKAKAERGY